VARAVKHLVPIDFSPCSEKALDYAVRFRPRGRGELLLVHALAEPALMVPVPVRGEYYRALEREVKARLLTLARRKKLAGKCRVKVIRAGDAASAIADEAKKSRARMIIMGSHGRTGLGRWILGSVTERTLRHAQCPVLVVKS
jgi:nucleotide-binding universal stress UspA family protein